MSNVVWPEGKTFGLCLTHDVDRIKKTFQVITHFLRDRRFYHFTSVLQDPNPYWAFDKIIEIERRYDVKSTFFFLNETKKHKIFRPSTYQLTFGRYNIFDPDVVKMIRKLDKQGWEIGLHGSYDSYKNIKLLKKEKKDLEKILKKPIMGVRQHYINLRIPMTWNNQKKIGLKYDSTYGTRKKIGFPKNIYLPFKPFHDQFLVIPFTIMDDFLFKPEISTEQAWDICLNIIDEAEKNGSLVTVIWHTERFNDNEFPGQMMIYERIIEECMKRNAFIGPCKDFYNLFSEDNKHGL